MTGAKVGEALLAKGAVDAGHLVNKAAASDDLTHWDEVVNWPADRQFLALFALVETIAHPGSRAALMERLAEGNR